MYVLILIAIIYILFIFSIIAALLIWRKLQTAENAISAITERINLIHELTKTLLPKLKNSIETLNVPNSLSDSINTIDTLQSIKTKLQTLNKEQTVSMNNKVKDCEDKNNNDDNENIENHTKENKIEAFPFEETTQSLSHSLSQPSSETKMDQELDMDPNFETTTYIVSMHQDKSKHNDENKPRVVELLDEVSIDADNLKRNDMHQIKISNGQMREASSERMTLEQPVKGSLINSPTESPTNSDITELKDTNVKSLERERQQEKEQEQISDNLSTGYGSTNNVSEISQDNEVPLFDKAMLTPLKVVELRSLAVDNNISLYKKDGTLKPRATLIKELLQVTTVV